MYLVRLISALAVLVFVLSACTTTVGVAEFQVYKRVFDDSKAVSTALIDQLAASEREIGRISTFNPGAKSGIDPIFVPENAHYYSDQADPPLAKEYRRAIATISTYNELMLAYATGQGFNDIQARAGLLGTEATALLSTAGIAAGQLTVYTQVLRSIAKFALNQRSTAVFRENFKESSDMVLKLLSEMKKQTPAAFKFVALLIELDITAVRGGVAKGDLAKLRTKHEQVRVLYSDWVIMLDKQAATIRATQYAIENPRLGIVLSGSTEAIMELRATAIAVRGHMAKASTL